jgi:LmbE family N-acetylglucosaminyl deacetylase
MLGVPPAGITFLDFEDGRLADHASEAQRRIAAIIRDFAPDEIYIPSAIDRHPDHRTLNRIAADLALAGEISCPMLQYPIWFFAFSSWMNPGESPAAAAVHIPARVAAAVLRLTPRLVRVHGYRKRKAAALSEHSTQQRGLPDEPGSPALDPRFVRHFFGRYEMFFPLKLPGPGKGPRREDRSDG